MHRPFWCFEMIRIELCTPKMAEILKNIRLRALQDTPLAFGSTFVRESKFTDADWIARATPRAGNGGQTYLAIDKDVACGLIGGYVDREDSSVVHLVSMWVAPTHRRLGVGKKLVQAVVDWSVKQGIKTVRLTVTNNNEGAIRFYERVGFCKTENTLPYPNDPDLFEYEMVQSIL